MLCAFSLFLKYPNPMAFQNGDTQVSLPSPFHFSHSNPFLLLLLPSAFPACSIYRSSCLLGKLDKCGNGSTPLSLLRRSLFWPAFEVQLQSASFPSRSLISNVRARPAPRRLRRQNNNFCRKVSSWRARRAIAPPSIKSRAPLPQLAQRNSLRCCGREKMRLVKSTSSGLTRWQ